MRLSDSSPSRRSLEQSLEQLMAAPSAVRYPARRLSWLQPLLRNLLNVLAGVETVQIEQRRDRTGSPYWLAYDPHTRTRHRFTSEREVRIWLEQRYHQS